MAIIQNREELTARLQTLLGDRTDDDALNFMQDAFDTFDSHSAGGITQAEHDRLMNEADQAWRQRYRDAFFKGADSSLKEPESDKSRKDPAQDAPGGDENNPAKFDDLFKEE